MSEDSSESIEKPVEEFNTPKKGVNSKKLVTATIFFALGFIACAFGWYKSEARFELLHTSKNCVVTFGLDGDVYTRRWKINGNKAAVLTDFNRDNNYEKASTYNFQDQLIWEGFDDDEDGYEERMLRYTPGGKVRYEYLDMDENGWHERMISYGKTLTVEYKDSDYDNEYDSIYVYENNVLINSLSVFDMGQFFKLVRHHRGDSTAIEK